MAIIFIISILAQTVYAFDISNDLSGMDMLPPNENIITPTLMPVSITPTPSAGTRQLDELRQLSFSSVSGAVQPPPPDIIVDGNPSEWTDDFKIATGELFPDFALYATINNGALFLMLKGSNLNTQTKYSKFYIDSDNVKTTGENYWNGSGQDYIIENVISTDGTPDTARILKYNNTTLVWDDLNKVVSDYVKTDSVIELSVNFSDIGYSDYKEIKIGHYYKNIAGQTNRTPALSQIAVLSPYVSFVGIPNAMGMAVDDLGWLNWYSATYNRRQYTIDDYQTVANVGRRAGTRIMTAWILGDLDITGVTSNIINNPPNTDSYMTARGLAYTTPTQAKKDEIKAITDKVKANSAYMEMGLHGVGHQHYIPGTNNTIVELSSEWANKGEVQANGYPLYWGNAQPWDYNSLVKRMNVAKDIIRQHFTEDECSFPKSMVAPQHGYFLGDGTSSQTTGVLMSSYGVKYGNGSTKEFTAPNTKGFIDNGLLFVDREYGAAQYAQGAVPTGYPDNDRKGWAEAHFPNYWGKENEWVSYLRGINNSSVRYLPANTAQASSQWLYRTYTSYKNINTQTAFIDTTQMPDAAYTKNLLGTLILKTKLPTGHHVSYASCSVGAQVMGYYEDGYGYAYLMIGNPKNYMGRIDKGQYTIRTTTTLGSTYLRSYVDLTGATYNLHSYYWDRQRAEVKLEMYGTQDIKVRVPFKPLVVESNNPKLIINSWSYAAPFVTINASATNVQGNEGMISINSFNTTGGQLGDINYDGIIGELTYSVGASITNNSANPVNTYMMIAVYDNDKKRLVQMRRLEKRFNANETYALNETFSAYRVYKNLNAKVYVWTRQGIKPLAPPVECSVIVNN